MHGVRVLDIASFIAAPFAAAILAEFGAEVIKFEIPQGGDPWRRYGTDSGAPDRSLAWLTEARNKKSATLNFRTPAGQDLFKRLVKDADVVCENFRPGTLEKWGIGPDVLLDINPGSRNSQGVRLWADRTLSGSSRLCTYCPCGGAG